MKRRSSKNDFSRNCKCILHDGDQQPYDIIKAKKFKKSIIEDFRSREILPSQAKYLCIECYQRYQLPADDEKSVLTTEPNISSSDQPTIAEPCHAEPEIPIQAASDEQFDHDSTNKPENPVASALKSLIALLENQSADIILNEETENLWSSLMFLIGNKLCNKRIYNDGLAICK